MYVWSYNDINLFMRKREREIQVDGGVGWGGGEKGRD